MDRAEYEIKFILEIINATLVKYRYDIVRAMTRGSQLTLKDTLIV
jgi:hypothetical protein